MISLGQRIAARQSGVSVLETGDIPIGAMELANSAPSPTVGLHPAVSIRNTDALLRVLAAHDGHAEAILLLSADLPAATAAALMAKAGATVLISDREDLAEAILPGSAVVQRAGPAPPIRETAWIMTTSGTTGRPKMVAHSLDRLACTVRTVASPGPVWGLTYEATRFAGMQVLLQAVLGGGTLVAPPLSLPLGERLAWFARRGVSHLSATPTLWRRILMHPSSSELALRQITLGGEIADQPLLDRLAAQFPEARITHIYASTEIGVGFSVKDGREGFPAAWLDEAPGDISMRVADGRLWLWAPRSGDMLGAEQLSRDSEGHVDSLDRVELRGDRVVFLGRDTGVVNVGGAKVHPETVERTLLAFVGVAMVRVMARKNPFSGAILVAEVLPDPVPEDPDRFRTELIRHCRNNLPPEAVPALVKLVEAIETNAAGKLTRRN